MDMHHAAHHEQSSRLLRVGVEVVSGLAGMLILWQLRANSAAVPTTSSLALAQFGALLALTTGVAWSLRIVRVPWAPRYAMMAVALLGVREVLVYASAYQGDGRSILLGLSFLFPIALLELFVVQPTCRQLIRRGWPGRRAVIVASLGLLFLILIERDVLNRLANWATSLVAVTLIVAGLLGWRLLCDGVARVTLALVLVTSLVTVIDNVARNVDPTAGPVPMEAVGVFIILGYVSWYTVSRCGRDAVEPPRKPSA